MSAWSPQAAILLLALIALLLFAIGRLRASNRSRNRYRQRHKP